MRPMYKDNCGKKGFSMIELIIVFAILAILSGFALANFTNVLSKSEKEVTRINLIEIAKLATADSVVSGTPTTSRVATFAKDFSNNDGINYSLTEGSTSSKAEISIYITTPYNAIFLATPVDSSTCLAVKYPSVGQVETVEIASSSCNAQSSIPAFN
jgi:prepilin-type N-terminal cleavage/methylation domain-containing protein